MNRSKYVLVSLFLALTLADALVTPFVPGTKAAFGAVAPAKIGQAAPEFTLTDTEGKKQSLSDYKGKFVVLEWINFNCPFVQKHYKSGNMQKLQEEYKGKGVVWLTINTSPKPRFTTAEVIAKLKEWNAHPTAFLQDVGPVAKLYGAKATPSMYVINPQGTLVYAGAIDDKDTVDEADIKTAKNYVSAALNEAMSGKKVKISLTKAYGCFVRTE